MYVHLVISECNDFPSTYILVLTIFLSSYHSHLKKLVIKLGVILWNSNFVIKLHRHNPLHVDLHNLCHELDFRFLVNHDPHLQSSLLVNIVPHFGSLRRLLSTILRAL